ncbi:Clp protease N-terminal domain-containing protein [Catellatospora sp. IY07-71]|uniref:Clp protease N-terminal domain-containing protein n=1 Tax=Catellatospora sp. IY07-71 TaxID=2728827 RepID=UPI001BB38886|nr:Clp protease N-terminal domain-containing protein [Catellatospora sp. IY07-71]
MISGAEGTGAVALRRSGPGLAVPRLSPGARVACLVGMMQAGAYGRSATRTEHLLLGLAGCPETTSARALASLGLTVEVLDAEVRRACGRGWLIRRVAMQLDPAVRALVGVLARQAPADGDRLIRSGDLLLALAEHGTAGGRRVLDGLGVGAADVRRVLAETPLAEGGHVETHIRLVDGRCVHG